MRLLTFLRHFFQLFLRAITIKSGQVPHLSWPSWKPTLSHLFYLQSRASGKCYFLSGKIPLFFHSTEFALFLILGPFEELQLTVNTSMAVIVAAMARPDSGLEIRDRMWLKITIPNAFIGKYPLWRDGLRTLCDQWCLFSGADVVEWLSTHVEGFVDRRDARKYASQMLKAGFIRHTVNKITFSEQCYYVFGDTLNAGEFLQSSSPTRRLPLPKHSSTLYTLSHQEFFDA